MILHCDDTSEFSRPGLLSLAPLTLGAELFLFSWGVQGAVLHILSYSTAFLAATH